MLVFSTGTIVIFGCVSLVIVSVSLGHEAQEYEVNWDGSAEVVIESSSEVCFDENTECQSFAERGECAKNWPYMSKHCRLGCRLCGDIPSDMTSWGVEQRITEHGESAADRARLTTKYMMEKVFVDPRYQTVRTTCKNTHEDCVRWASTGECEANPQFMRIKCAPACFTCELLDFNLRCPMDPEATPALDTGDLDQLFKRLILEFPRYKPTVHSMPRPTSDDILDGPWVVTLDKFLTDEECDRLVQHGKGAGYERSFQFSGEFAPDGSEVRQSGTSRTSSNAWCVKETCHRDPIVQGVMNRIVEVVGIPEENCEFLQLLFYEKGQFYKSHHDMIEYQKDRPTGVRVLTVFLYLNEVEAGGATLFNTLNLTVTPRKGKALIWPSVFSDNPHKADKRTRHEALPVVAGEKYAANAWFHQYNFKQAFLENCH